MININEFIIITLCYLIGSIPFGLLLTKFFKNTDLQAKGSGNIGATNALRVGGKLLGLLTLIADMLKGVIVVMIAERFVPNLLLICIDAVIFGHIFSCWLRFKGGKGVATFIGTILSSDFYLGAITIIVYVIVFMIFRISSTSTLCSLFCGLIVSAFTNSITFTMNFGLLYLVILYKHKDNISRLINNQEEPLKLF